MDGKTMKEMVGQVRVMDQASERLGELLKAESSVEIVMDLRALEGLTVLITALCNLLLQSLSVARPRRS